MTAAAAAHSALRGVSAVAAVGSALSTLGVDPTRGPLDVGPPAVAGDGQLASTMQTVPVERMPVKVMSCESTLISPVPQIACGMPT